MPFESSGPVDVTNLDEYDEDDDDVVVQVPSSDEASRLRPAITSTSEASDENRLDDGSSFVTPPRRRTALLEPLFGGSALSEDEDGDGDGDSVVGNGGRSARGAKRAAHAGNGESRTRGGAVDGSEAEEEAAADAADADADDDDLLAGPHPWKSRKELAKSRRRATTKKAKRALARGMLVRRIRAEEEMQSQLGTLAAAADEAGATHDASSADAALERLYQARMTQVLLDERRALEDGRAAAASSQRDVVDAHATDGGESAASSASADADGPFVSEDRLRALLDEDRSITHGGEARTPVEFVAAVSLLRHQREALHWMIQRENDPREHTPCGGILADDQGLGKTVTTLALIMANKPPKPAGELAAPELRTLVVCPLSLLHQWAREVVDRIDEGMRPSVLLYHGPERTKNPRLLERYDIVLTTYSVIQHEYPKADPDGKVHLGRAGALFRVRWRRLVLDEAQYIRNRFSHSARAACLFEAQRRWCLTGTPVHNTVDDLYSLCLFLRYSFVRDVKHWNALYKRLIEGRNESARVFGFQRLRAALKPIMLRRTKRDEVDGRPVLALPPRTFFRRELELSPHERDYYDAFESRGRIEFEQLLRDHAVMENYIHVLVMLTRMRQMCDHYALVKRDEMGQLELSRALREYMATGGRMPPEVRERLWQVLNDESECMCPVCTEALQSSSGSITPCGHLFCNACLERWLNEHSECPLCRQPCRQRSVTPMDEVYEALKREHERRAAAEEEEEEEEGARRAGAGGGKMSSSRKRQSRSSAGVERSRNRGKGEEKLMPSTKLAALVKEVRRILGAGASATTAATVAAAEEQQRTRDAGDEEDKCIVFSQWTRMLDLCEDALLDAGIPVCRLDGQMNQDERERNLVEFRRPGVRVMLLSLHAGGVGLNLTQANHVVMVDSWWNPALEEQAIDRVHRIGQSKPVHVVRLVIRDSVEQRVFELQEKKRAVSAGALGDGDGGDGTGTGAQQRLGVRDLQRLFGAHAGSRSGRRRGETRR